MNALKEGGVLKKWGAGLEEPYDRRNVFLGDLKRVGVLNPSGIGVASIRKSPPHFILQNDGNHFPISSTASTEAWDLPCRE